MLFVMPLVLLLFMTLVVPGFMIVFVSRAVATIIGFSPSSSSRTPRKKLSRPRPLITTASARSSLARSSGRNW